MSRNYDTMERIVNDLSNRIGKQDEEISEFMQWKTKAEMRLKDLENEVEGLMRLANRR